MNADAVASHLRSMEIKFVGSVFGLVVAFARLSWSRCSQQTENATRSQLVSRFRLCLGTIIGVFLDMACNSVQDVD